MLVITTSEFDTDQSVQITIISYSFQILGFPCGSDGKESAYNAGGPGLIPG